MEHEEAPSNGPPTSANAELAEDSLVEDSFVEPSNSQDAPRTASQRKAKKKKSQADRLAELSKPKIRDDRIKPGMHVYKPPVRGLAYSGTDKMAMYADRRDGGMTYKHIKSNEKGDCKLSLRETSGKEKIILKGSELTGSARQRAIENASGTGIARNNGRAAGPRPNVPSSCIDAPK